MLKQEKSKFKTLIKTLFNETKILNFFHIFCEPKMLNTFMRDYTNNIVDTWRSYDYFYVSK